MANKLRLARGSAANKPNDLVYGELFWEKVETNGSDGILYMGSPDGEGGTEPDLKIGGARAMESLHYKGEWTSPGSVPSNPEVGDMYLWQIDGTGAQSDYKIGDFMLYTGTEWLRINNQITEELDAANVTFDPNDADLTSTTVQAGITEVAEKKLHYVGTFSASGGTYPTEEVGGFYISDDIGTVNGITYEKGDAAFYDGTDWEKIPFSEGFPAAGVTYSNAQTNQLAKWSNNSGDLTTTNISDNGSEVDITGNTTVTGQVKANDLQLGGGTQHTTTIEAAPGSGSFTLTLPGAGGTLARLQDHDEASEIEFDKTGTGIDATTVQNALAELDEEKLQYVGEINTLTFPTPAIIGGLYLLKVSGAIGTFTFNKGDFAYYDGTNWNRIPAGAARAVDVDFDNTNLELPNGDPVSQTDVQAALAHLFTLKADVDGNGKIPADQLPAFVTGSLSYMGTWDASTGAPDPSPRDGDYYVVTQPGIFDTVDYEIGDWIVYHVEPNDTTGVWDKIDNSDKLSGIKVGGDTLVGAPEIAADLPLTVTADTSTITLSANNATTSATGVMQVGEGLKVNGGLVDVDTGDGLKIDNTTKAATIDFGRGLTIDGSGRLELKVTPNLTLLGSGGNFALDLANSGVTPDTYTKVTVDIKGRVTGATNIEANDVPIDPSGNTGKVEIYDNSGSTGTIAAIDTVGPGVNVSKTVGNLIQIDFTQLAADSFASEFNTTTPAAFDWSTRETGTDSIVSITGAINANREDLTEFVAKLAARGAAAGATLIGVNGITDVTPTGESEGNTSGLQAMLEGLKQYTDEEIVNNIPTDIVNTTGNPVAGDIAVFDDADTIKKSHLTQDATKVYSAEELEVQERVSIQGTGAELRLDAGGGAYTNLQASEDGEPVTTLTLPSEAGITSGTILADFSVIDGGDFDTP